MGRYILVEKRESFKDDQKYLKIGTFDETGRLSSDMKKVSYQKMKLIDNHTKQLNILFEKNLSDGENYKISPKKPIVAVLDIYELDSNRYKSNKSITNELFKITGVEYLLLKQEGNKYKGLFLNEDNTIFDRKKGIAKKNSTKISTVEVDGRDFLETYIFGGQEPRSILVYKKLNIETEIIKNQAKDVEILSIKDLIKNKKAQENQPVSEKSNQKIKVTEEKSKVKHDYDSLIVTEKEIESKNIQGIDLIQRRVGQEYAKEYHRIGTYDLENKRLKFNKADVEYKMFDASKTLPWQIFLAKKELNNYEVLESRPIVVIFDINKSLTNDYFKELKISNEAFKIRGVDFLLVFKNTDKYNGFHLTKKNANFDHYLGSAQIMNGAQRVYPIYKISDGDILETQINNFGRFTKTFFYRKLIEEKEKDSKKTEEKKNSSLRKESEVQQITNVESQKENILKSKKSAATITPNGQQIKIQNIANDLSKTRLSKEENFESEKIEKLLNTIIEKQLDQDKKINLLTQKYDDLHEDSKMNVEFENILNRLYSEKKEKIEAKVEKLRDNLLKDIQNQNNNKNDIEINNKLLQITELIKTIKSEESSKEINSKLLEIENNIKGFSENNSMQVLKELQRTTRDMSGILQNQNNNKNDIEINNKLLQITELIKTIKSEESSKEINSRLLEIENNIKSFSENNSMQALKELQRTTRDMSDIFQNQIKKLEENVFNITVDQKQQQQVMIENISQIKNELNNDTSIKFEQLIKILLVKIEEQNKIIEENSKLSKKLARINEVQRKQFEVTYKNGESISNTGARISDQKKLQDILNTNFNFIKTEKRELLYRLLYQADRAKQPIFLCGPKSQEIVNVYSMVNYAKKPGVLDCNMDYNSTIMEEIRQSDDDVILVKNIVGSNWIKAINDIISMTDKEIFFTSPFKEDLKKADILLDYVILIATNDLINAKENVNYNDIKVMKFLKKYREEYESMDEILAPEYENTIRQLEINYPIMIELWENILANSGEKNLIISELLENFDYLTGGYTRFLDTKKTTDKSKKIEKQDENSNKEETINNSVNQKEIEDISVNGTDKRIDSSEDESKKIKKQDENPNKEETINNSVNQKEIEDISVNGTDKRIDSFEDESKKNKKQDENPNKEETINNPVNQKEIENISVNVADKRIDSFEDESKKIEKQDENPNKEETINSPVNQKEIENISVNGTDKRIDSSENSYEESKEKRRKKGILSIFGL